MTISTNVNASAVISMDGDVGLDDGFSLGGEVGRAEDVGRAGDVVLGGGSNVVGFGYCWRWW